MKTKLTFRIVLIFSLAVICLFHVKNVTPKWKDTVLDIFLNFSGAVAFIAVKTLLI